MAMNEEARRFNVELFADVLANLDEIPTTGAAGAGFGFVPVFDARQFGRQGIAAAAFVRAGRIGRRLLFCKLGVDSRAIRVAGLDKEISLLGGQRFALATEADSLEISELEGEFLYLQLAPLEFGVTSDERGIAFGELRF